ncbi:MAG: S-layer homology domain-containing protein [Clostridia bacterium]|nr:S-layer homology domain-containing protein [Clostridia bacterium]
MKKLFISLVALVFAVCVSASAGAALLSPGISVLQSTVKMEKSGVAGNSVTFCAEDFAAALGAKSLSAVTVTSLPEKESGVLMLGEKAVAVGDKIPAEKLSELCFVPAKAGVNACFGFIPEGGAYTESFTCVISMTEEKLNLAPTTKHSEIADMAGITVFSVLCGEDSEGEKLHFSIVTGASHGTVEITDEQTGAYRYTPDEGFSGKDSFTFCAKDAGGNISNISTVTVNVARNDKNIVYSDMEDSALHLAAAVLYENDIMLGEKNGSVRTFNPEGKVTRSDFLIMAMNTAKIAAKAGETTFADKADFSPYESKYIATAQSLGITVGRETDGGRCFAPDEYITDEEAALIVCRIAALEGIGIVDSDVSVAIMENDEYDALAVLANAGVFASSTPQAELSRADTVEILYALLGYCK